MIQTALASLLTASILTLSAPSPEVSGSAEIVPQAQQAQVELGSASMSLDNRLAFKGANDVYKDNILLNLAYLSGEAKEGQSVNWDQIRKPFSIQFNLEPNQRFAFHDTLLLEYSEGVVLTTNSHFNAEEGYKSDGNLYGMGVCHLASLINMAAKKAGLESIVPTNHDFYTINEVPREYGVAIFSSPDSALVSAKQNLYIKNNLESKVTFKFDFDGVNLKVSVLK